MDVTPHLEVWEWSSFADPSVDLGEDQVAFLVHLVGIIK
jgi:hypothetical protein